MPFGTEKNILEDLFSAALSQLKYHLSGNLRFNYLGIFQSLKLSILVGKIVRISLELNFTPNTLGCLGLSCTLGLPTRNLKVWGGKKILKPIF